MLNKLSKNAKMECKFDFILNLRQLYGRQEQTFLYLNQFFYNSVVDKSKHFCTLTSP